MVLRMAINFEKLLTNLCHLLVQETSRCNGSLSIISISGFMFFRISLKLALLVSET